MAIEKEFFRQVMGRFATGITVVTTINKEEPVGLTVNSFSSVSLNPPLILICVDIHSHTLPFFRESQSFAVNMLTEKQEYLSRIFSSEAPERYEYFSKHPYRRVVTGAPVFHDVLAFIDASIVAEYPGGDHVIFLGQVEAMGTANKVVFLDETKREQSTLIEARNNGKQAPDNTQPLLYYKGQYQHLSRQAENGKLTISELLIQQEQTIEEATKG